MKVNRLLIPLSQEELYNTLRLKESADGSLLEGAGHAQTDLANLLGKLYKKGVRNLEGGEPHESMLYKLGQWAIALIALG